MSTDFDICLIFLWYFETSNFSFCIQQEGRDAYAFVCSFARSLVVRDFTRKWSTAHTEVALEASSVYM